MSITLFSGKTQPYGLLSNHAIVPMTIDGTRYTSVTDYVYRNLFSNPEAKELMSKVKKNHFSAALDINSATNARIYIDALVLGTRARYMQDRAFKAALLLLGDKAVKVEWGTPDENRRLYMLFNQLRFSPEQVFFDDKYGEVPFARVNAVVVGVAQALISNANMGKPNIPSEPFNVLEQKYTFKTAAPRRDLVAALSNLDEIVPVLKIKLKDAIFKEEISKFKKHLLDVSLNYILSTNYPHLNPSQYQIAKHQQIVKEPSISRYEDQLYDMYIIGDLPSEVVSNLQMRPVHPLTTNVTVGAIIEQEEASDNIFDLDASLANVALQNRDAIPIPAIFLPDAPTTIRIKGVTYPNVVSYAYSVLFNIIGYKINVNDPIEKLAKDFGTIDYDMFAHRLTDLNEKATRAKYSNNPSLVQLLLTTRGKGLVYSDTDDAVLGIGRQQLNRAGVFLEFLRDEYAKSVVPPVEPFTSLFSNIVIKEWVESRAADYANTLKMFKLRNQLDIAYIYDIQPADINVDSISAPTISIMNSGGLNSSDQKLILPFIAAEFMALKAKGIPGIVQSYNLTSPSSDTRVRAEQTLDEMYQIVKRNLLPNINHTKFISTILSNQQVYDVNQDQWWRVHKWAAIKRRHIKGTEKSRHSSSRLKSIMKPQTRPDSSFRAGKHISLSRVDPKLGIKKRRGVDLRIETLKHQQQREMLNTLQNSINI